MSHDTWTLVPNKSGSVSITLVSNKSGKRLETEMDPSQVGAFVAGLSAAFCNSFRMSGRPEPPVRYSGTIPPIHPDVVALLNPTGKSWAMLLKIGEANIVIDISGVDTRDLGQALLSKPTPD